MTIEYFHGEGVARPTAPLSQVAASDGLVFISGQIPLNADGKVDGDGIETQARRALANLQSNLKAAGLGLRDVIKVNGYLADLADAPGYNRVYESVFAPPFPARTTIGAALPGFRIEVEAVAARPATVDAPRPSNAAVALVEAAYEAWDGEDQGRLAALLAQDAEAHQDTAIPWGAEARGRDAFLRYAAGVKRQLDANATVEQLYPCGDDVVAVGHSAGAVRATGGRFDVRFVHVWTVRDGRISRFVAYVDTDALAPALADAS
jgi:enamine deaminase RidA (YjgF/YER057c/UK114 family)/ketosteroid isomerase-like protein